MWVEDDGKDDAGGCQRSIKTLPFWVTEGLKVLYEWDCPMEIDMPIRSRAQGTISPSRASLWTAEAANNVVNLELQAGTPTTGSARAPCSARS